MSSSSDYLDRLSAELGAAGIRGRQRARILAEIADHLACDPNAPLGSPVALAGQFADELGTSMARRAAWWSFGALAAAGTVMAGALLGARLAGAPLGGVHLGSSVLGLVASVAAVLGAQVASVAGGLAAWRALRLRRATVLARDEATIIVRRAYTGLAAGIVAMIGLAGIAVRAGGLPSWWTSAVLAGTAASSVGLLACAPAVASAVRIRPRAAGVSGDLFDDLGRLVPRPLRGRAWTFAVITAVVVAVAITAAGAVASDGYDGAARGLADAAACLAGFLVLGRYLGLRD